MGHIRLITNVLLSTDARDSKRGHIYIAQPPLYKVKFKEETYIKDDNHLENHLLKIAKDNAILIASKMTKRKKVQIEGKYLALAKRI